MMTLRPGLIVVVGILLNWMVGGGRVDAGTPLLELRDTATLRTRTSSRLVYESNLFKAASGAKSDTRSVISPGVDYDWNSTDVEASAFGMARYDIYRYWEHGDLDDEAPSLYGKVVRKWERVAVNGSASYFKVMQNTPDQNFDDLLVKAYYTAFEVNSSFDVGKTFNLNADFNFLKRNYVTSGLGLVSYESYMVPVAMYHRVTETFLIGIGGRGRYFRNERVNDAQDTWIYCGVRSDWAKNMSFKVEVGPQRRHIKGGEEYNNQIGVKGSLLWQFTEKDRLEGSYTIDNAIGGLGQNLKVGSGVLRWTRHWTDKLSVGLSGVWMRMTFLDSERRDFWQNYGVEVVHKLNDYWQVKWEYGHQRNYSTVGSNKYENNIGGMELTFTY